MWGLDSAVAAGLSFRRLASVELGFILSSVSPCVIISNRGVQLIATPKSLLRRE